MTSRETRNMVCPESTIESANRRNFIRKAALSTAAAGFGGALIGKNLLPQSSAASASCPVTYCDVIVQGCLAVDNAGKNDGYVNECFGAAYALRFGPNFSCSPSGQAIASSQNSCINPFGLDFYTDYEKRVSITQCGQVGIGTDTPTAALDVVGRVIASCTAIDGVAIGGAASGTGSTGISGVGCIGVSGESCFSTGIGVRGQAYAKGGIGVQGSAGGACSIPIVARGACKQCANLQQWENSVGTPLSVVNKSGWLGIGTSEPLFPLEVFDGSVFVQCFEASGSAIGGSALGSKGIGVCGIACGACGVGVRGQAIAKGGIGVQGSAGGACSIPIVARGASGQAANLQQWEGNCGTVYAVINKAGSLGLGGVTKPHHVLCISGKAHASSGFSIGPCTCINTTLAVNGSFAAKTRTVGATSCLSTTDYAILATGTITLTLPPAKTQNGMMIFIKNTSSSTVSVVPGGSDTIEGATSSSPKTLGKQYDSLQLISNGSNEWFIVGSVKCGAVIS